MGGFRKKVPGVIKAVLTFILNNLIAIIGLFGGATMLGIIAALGRFFGIFSGLVKIVIKPDIPLWVLIIFSPFLIYAVVMQVLRLVNFFRKPPYLSFTTMVYEKWKLEWEYEYDKKSKKYVVKNICPVCHNCGCEMEYIRMGNAEGIFCPVCKDDLFEPFEKYSPLRKVIEHRIRTKNFRSKENKVPDDSANGKKE
jgi:hypothetical protein